MPTVLLIDGFRFFFFSDEGTEPCHIHVSKGGARAKIWLQPVFQENYYYGFNEQEKKKIRKIVQDNEDLIIGKWNEYFGRR